MAYLTPEMLTCASCGKSQMIQWVIGEGPNTKPGQGPDYTDVMDSGDWQVQTTQTAPIWHGEITCPHCSHIVKRQP